MPVDYFKAERRWLAIIPVAIIVISVIVWFATRDTLPKTIRVATAHEGGLYHEFGESLQASLERRTGCQVVIVETEGSVENGRLLREGKVDLAIVQSGSGEMKRLSVIAPLYPEVVHVVTRRGSPIQSVDGLESKRVVYGPDGSGMRTSAERVLEHYGISEGIINPTNVYFKGLLEDESIDAAIVTTGFMNRDLQGLLASGEFVLLPIDGAEAIAIKDPFFHVAEIPRGLYREGTPVPSVGTPTVATTALLVVGEDESELLISKVMEAIYDEGLGLEFPTLISRNEVIAKSPVALHPVSRAFFNPPDHINRIAQIMETLAAFKELSVAFAAGLYLLWTRRKRLREVRLAKTIQQQKDKLDVFLEKTLEVERGQMNTTNVEELQEFLDQVTEIKLEALTKFTHEELRSDQAFSIFLLQCANLISKIQMKILHCSLRT